MSTTATMTTSEAPKASGAQGIFAKSPMIFSIDSKNETLFSKFVAKYDNRLFFACLLVGWDICFAVRVDGIAVYT